MLYRESLLGNLSSLPEPFVSGVQTELQINFMSLFLFSVLHSVLVTREKSAFKHLGSGYKLEHARVRFS